MQTSTIQKCWRKVRSYEHLHKIKDELHKMLVRENREKLAKACFDFIEYRTDLDNIGWSDQDIFKH